MKKIGNYLKSDIVFFAGLFLLLFLGDGKQTIVDVVGIAVVLFLWLSRKMYHRTAVAPLPFLIEQIWTVLLVYLVCTTLFSISVGFSLSSTLRYFMAYLVFIYFYSATIKEKHKFGTLLMWFSTAAVLASFVAVIVGRIGQALPNMNLLYPRYGHNYIVGIIIFGTPLVIAYIRQKRNVFSALILTLFGIALVFSFARGAMVLVGGYLLFRLVVRRDIRFKSEWVLGAVVIACFVGASIYIVGGTQKTQLTSFARRQVVKESITESRIPYWKQALLAIRDRPIFGTGPGTFYLLSKQYQDRPLNYSWYAHSYILEAAAESGIVGVIVIVFLLWNIFQLIIRQAPKQQPLLDGVVLTFIYSLFEFNFNFLVIWLLFWAVAGTLLRDNEEKEARRHRAVTVAIVILIAYYVMSVVSAAAEIVTHNSMSAAVIEPYNIDKSLRVIESATKKKTLLPAWIQDSSYVFDSGDPEMLMDLAQYTNSRLSPDWNLYQKAVDADPQNTDYFFQYVSALLDNNKQSRIGRVLEAKGQQVFPLSSRRALQSVDWSSSVITSLFTKDLLKDVGQPTTVAEYLSKIYYFLGFSFLNSSPSLTRVFWTLARDASPGWGYFHVELASLEYTILHNPGAAKQDLKQCQQYPSAAGQCKNVRLSTIEPVGYFYNYVKDIPSVDQ